MFVLKCLIINNMFFINTYILWFVVKPSNKNNDDELMTCFLSFVYSVSCFYVQVPVISCGEDQIS